MKDQTLLKAIIDNADRVITINEEGIVELINPAACRLFLYEPKEIIGNNTAMLMPSPHLENHDSCLKNYIQSGIPHIIGTANKTII